MIKSFCCDDEDNTPCTKCVELSNPVENANVYLSKHREPEEIGDKKKEVEKKILTFLGGLTYPPEKEK